MYGTLKGRPAPSSGDVMEKSILAMTRDATPLLKFSKGGKPGFRAFTLSHDLMSLTWQSKNKDASQTRIAIADMKELRTGQRTEKFKKSNRPDLEALSFSILYLERSEAPGVVTNETLDLVCRDDAELAMWTSVLTMLIEGRTDLTPYLLAIQKRQLEQQKEEQAEAAGERNKKKMKQATMVSRADKKNRILKAKEAFRQANDVYAFGWGEWGQNGVGKEASSTVESLEVCAAPKLLESLLGKHVVHIAQGWSHTAMLLESGELLQYGNRIGTGLSEDYLAPTLTPLSVSLQMSEKLNIVQLACGAYHTAALTDAGQVLTWGSNALGQLGHGTRLDIVEPKFIENLRVPAAVVDPAADPATQTANSAAPGAEVFVIQVACGASYTALLTDESVVYTFGSGAHGVLGHGDLLDRDVPTIVEDLAGADIQNIATGDGHMFAATMKEVYAWGWGAFGQLGLGKEEDQHRPQVIETLRGSEVKELAAGVTHSFALVHITKVNQDVLFSWGSNAQGQLGQGKKAKLLRPNPVTITYPSGSGSDSPIVEVKCGAFHTLVRNEKGEVFAAGSNRYGQCGAKAPMIGANGLVLPTATGAPQGEAIIDEFRQVESLKDKSARSLCCGGENSSVLTARAWVDDIYATECMACKAPFTFTNRKHHCRNCGGIFCGSCSQKKIAILKLQVMEPVRVCNSCFTMLGGR